MTQEPRPDLPALREEMASMREELARAWAIVDGEPKRLAEARRQGAAEERARLLALIPQGWECHDNDECDYCRVVRLLVREPDAATVPPDDAGQER